MKQKLSLTQSAHFFAIKAAKKVQILTMSTRKYHNKRHDRRNLLSDK